MPLTSDSVLDIITFTPEQLDEAYNLYLENNAIYDEYIEKYIANGLLTYDEFIDVLEQQNTAGYCVVHVIELDNHYNYALQDNDNCVMNVFKGFLVYEINDNKDYDIIFLEVDNQEKILIEKLLNWAKKKNKNKKLYLHIKDGNYNLMKIVGENGFKEEKMIRSQNNLPDTFIFSYQKLKES